MGSDCATLEQAITLVDHEQSYLCEERRAYEAFREQVRLVTPDPSDATGPSETTEQLMDAYREEVMDALDYETVYGDTLAESLEVELSPAIAGLFVAKEPLTQRRKRDLLVNTTAAIERREEFCAALDDEWAALETFIEELAQIEETLEKLPVCSPQDKPLGKLLDIWEVYDTLFERCDRLLNRRQQQMREAEQSVRILGKRHARNEFLYSDLDTRYPVLSAIAATCDQIDKKRNGEQTVDSPDQSLQY